MYSGVGSHPAAVRGCIRLAFLALFSPCTGEMRSGRHISRIMGITKTNIVVSLHYALCIDAPRYWAGEMAAAAAVAVAATAANDCGPN